MRGAFLSAGAAAATLFFAAGCQAQSAPPWANGQPGWRMGPYGGSMMYYGYCPGAANDGRSGAQGWYGPGMMGRGMMGGAGPWSFDPAQTTAWLDTAKSQIAITAQQEKAWSAYADAVKADRDAMVAMHNQMPAAMGWGASAPDRLQAHLALMSSRLASLETVQAATKGLYDALTPEQRTRADRVLWSGC
jgi:hypothetical protein